MKHYLLILTALIALMACKNRTPEQKKEATEDVMSAAGEVSTTEPDSVCYLLSEGLSKKKDTTVVQLFIKGNDVTGSMVYLPYEKDKRSGSIAGKKQGKRIEAMWIFMQEGMTDSISITLRLEDNVLKQQQSTFDQHTGKEYFPNNAAYTRYYQQVDCSVVEGKLE
jgi:hypothetical protein